MRLINIVKTWDFTENNRARMTFNGLRLNPGRARVELSRVELPPDEDNETLYSTELDLSVTSWTTTPMSAMEWRGFEAEVTHVRDPDGTGTVVTSAGFRLRNASNQYWWDGSAWVVNNTDWNTEAEVAANIAAFPIATRTIGVVVNLITTDARVTPTLQAVKVLYGSNHEPEEDYIIRSLIPYLKEGVRPIGRLNAQQVAMGTTFTLAAALVSTPYDVVDVDSVFNETADPDMLTNLLASYNPTTRVITLSSSVAAGQNLRINFIYRPLVARATSRDFDELNRVPAILIEEQRLLNKSERGGFDTVMNRATGQGVKVYTPSQGDYELAVTVITDKLVDQARLAQETRRHIVANPLMNSRGLDEPTRVWLIDDGEAIGLSNPKDIHSSVLRIRIVGALFFERGSEPTTAVSGFGTSPDSNLNLAVP